MARRDRQNPVQSAETGQAFDPSALSMPVAAKVLGLPEATLRKHVDEGLHRSGSSALAGVLHKLGVHLGNQLGGYEPTGGFEAITLGHLCERAYPFPSTALAVPRERLVGELRSFIDEKRREAFFKNTIAGGKYPHLCAMGDELREICGDALRVIHISRSLDESIASLKKRSAKETGWLHITDDQAEAVQRWLWDSKNTFLAEVEHLTIEFDDLRTNPAGQIGRIIEYLKIDPTDAQLAAARGHMHVDRMQVA